MPDGFLDPNRLDLQARHSSPSGHSWVGSLSAFKYSEIETREGSEQAVIALLRDIEAIESVSRFFSQNYAEIVDNETGKTAKKPLEFRAASALVVNSMPYRGVVYFCVSAPNLLVVTRTVTENGVVESINHPAGGASSKRAAHEMFLEECFSYRRKNVVGLKIGDNFYSIERGHQEGEDLDCLGHPQDRLSAHAGLWKAACG